MSLRRSARVQALEPTPAAVNKNSLKRAFATTKAVSSNTLVKDFKEPITAEVLVVDQNGKENETLSNLSPKPETRGKRLKAEPKVGSGVTILASASLPEDHVNNAAQATIGERPVEPHATNAPLILPQDHKVTTIYSNFEDTLPATADSALSAPTSTTITVLAEATAHLLENDTTGRLTPFIAKFPCSTFSPAGLAEPVDPFSSLASGIMGQQVSGAAAKSIKNKFIALFPADTTHNHPGPPGFPPPSLVAQMTIPTLRSAGLSQRKAEYIQGMAEKFVSGELSTEMLLTASDDEVMQKLVAVRGLGKWSVEMFALFGLKRLDVFSTGDLGVQRGMAVYVGKDVGKLKAKGGGKWKYMSEKDMLDISAPFAPYRSLFTWYMWRLSDVDIEALDKA